MKKLIIKKGAWLLLSFVGLVFVACNQEDIHDFNKQEGSEPANSAYISDSVFTYSVLWTLDGEYTVPDTIIVKFPIRLTEAAKSEMKVTFDVDYNQIAVYNAAHGTSYYPIALEDLALAPNRETVTIEEGQTVSKDSVTIAVSRPMKKLTDLGGYLIPLKIRRYEGTDVGIDYQKRHSYVVIDVVYENIVQAGSITAVNAAYDALADVDFKLSSLYPIQGQNDAKVQLSVNNEQIAAFNSMMGTDYQPMPSGLTSSYEVNMSKGKSEGFFKLAYSGSVSTLNDPRGYVVPLEITSVTGESIKMPEGNAMLYAIIHSNACEFVPSDTLISGTRVTDRTGYSMARFVYSNGTEPRFATGNKNSPLSGGMFVIQPLQDELNMTIDLGAEVQNITGFHIQNMSADNNDKNIRTLDVGYATELMYKEGGSIGLRKNINPFVPITDPEDPPVNPPKNCYVKFDKPITARYILIDNIMHNNGSYLGLNNFYIYTQP